MSESPQVLFKRWLTEHAGTACKLARAYTATREDCQDLVQEILLQAWRSLPRFQGLATESTWFYRVALNTALTWKRKERRRRACQQPLFDVEDASLAGSDGAAQAGRRELVERLYVAIRQLSKTDAAIVLLYLDQLSYRQMAEVLGISESNVGTRLNRAKKALSNLLPPGAPHD